MTRLAQGLDAVQPLLNLAGRTLLGALLALALGVLGIAIAWAMFVFFGARSHAVLLAMFMIGAGMGSGLGSLLAWTRIDGVPSRPILLTAALLVVLAGIAGSWVGFQFGATREVECCVGPAIEPITYMVGGAALFANLAALVMAVAYDVRLRATGRNMYRSARAGLSGGSSSESRRLPN